MRFSVWPSPERPWSEIRHIVRACDEAGWDGAYFADHFMPNDPGGRPLDGPTLECWAVLAALAECTTRIRLGPLVSGNLYRHPAVLANQAAAIDHISAGRFVLGLGAGWQVNEHAAYGIELGSVRDRLDRLEEAATVIRSLLDQDRTTYPGRHYQLSEAPAQPRPVQDRLPLLIGGRGEKRTMRIAAALADEWNAWATPTDFRHKCDVLDRHCEEVGRNPADIQRSTQAMVFLSHDTAWLAQHRQSGPARPVIVGTPSEVVDQVGAYREAGVDELIVPDWTMGEEARVIDTLSLFWTEVAPEFR